MLLCFSDVTQITQNAQRFGSKNRTPRFYTFKFFLPHFSYFEGSTVCLQMLMQDFLDNPFFYGIPYKGLFHSYRFFISVSLFKHFFGCQHLMIYVCKNGIKLLMAVLKHYLFKFHKVWNA